MTEVQSQVLDIKKALQVANQAADLGRGILLSHFGKLSHISEKYMAGLVSEADRESEEVISQHMRKNFPSFGILGEEYGRTSGSGGEWIIDPLDGTTNYVHQFPIFSISIALRMNEELVLGVVDVPKLGDRFYAAKGEGAFLNGKPIRVSEAKQMKETLLATGFYNLQQDILHRQLRLFEKAICNSRDVRRAGSAAYDLCLVAQGVFAGFWEANLSPWDTAAGVVMVREAGGIVTNYEGDFFFPEMKTILAGSSMAHSEMTRIFSDQLS